MSNATLAVSTAVLNVEEAVEKVINDADQFFPEAATIGDAVRQGDVYIQLIEPLTEAPAFYTKLKKPEFPLQLAPGDTKGSRHMLEYSAGIEVWTCDAEKLSIFNPMADDSDDIDALRRNFATQLEKYSVTCSGEDVKEAQRWGSQSRVIGDTISQALALCGPIFVLQNCTTVSHPEHGNWILPPGTYRVTFQRTLDRDMHIQRVFD
jgi:hypothetical protein